MLQSFIVSLLIAILSLGEEKQGGEQREKVFDSKKSGVGTDPVNQTMVRIIDRETWRVMFARTPFGRASDDDDDDDDVIFY